MQAAEDFQKQLEVMVRALKRERAARKDSELLLEDKSRELYLSNQGLEESLNNLKHTQSQLVQSEKMASVGQLAAGIAHEINNPVGFISSNLSTLMEYIDDLREYFKRVDEVLEKDQDTVVVRDSIHALREEIDFDYIVSDIHSLVNESIHGAARVKQIVADLSEFSHVNGPDISEENISLLIKRTLNLARNQLKYDVDVCCELLDLPLIHCNGAKIGQVLLNLIINAAHAMEKNENGRQLVIKTRLDKDFVSIEVRDNGTGIPQEKLSCIFDPFFTTKEVGKGTGLGLHIAQDIIVRHQGKIHVESSLGEGTSFYISLPICTQST